MVRRGGMSNADTTAQQDWHAQSPARHVLHLGDLVDDFADAVEAEISEHEIDDRPSASHGCSACESGKTALADRCVTEPDGTIEVIKARGRHEVTAPFADPFAEDKDSRVHGHLFTQSFKSRLHV